jgi:hypothetical protein
LIGFIFWLGSLGEKAKEEKAVETIPVPSTVAD